MGSRDPRVDKYIETKAADFAKPILLHFRELVHRGCPEVEETIKWGMPSFEYKGPFCGMAAFKQHCVIGFWKSELLFGDSTNVTPSSATAKAAKMNWGAPGRAKIPAKIMRLDDLPSDTTILRLIKQAKRLNDEGVKLSRPKTKRSPIPVPRDFSSALKSNASAAAIFKALSPSHRREYLEWIVEAKKPETRLKRMAAAIELLAEGKSKNWKYERK